MTRQTPPASTGKATWQILTGDVREMLALLPDGSVQAFVTSSPYWGGLRDYGMTQQVGLERHPDEYAETVVAVMASVRRVLRPSGVAWVNVGDAYAASGKGGGGNAGDRAGWETIRERKGFRMPPRGYKMKDLSLVAFKLAEALRYE